MSRFKRQADAREDYAWARSFLPKEDVAIFEAVVCHNVRVGEAGQRKRTNLSRSQAGTKTQAALKLCVNLLRQGIGHRLNIGLPAMIAPTGAPPISTLAPVLTPGRPVSGSIDEALAKAEAEGATGLLISPSVLAALRRENGAREMVSHRSVMLLVQEHWGLGMDYPKAVAGIADCIDNEYFKSVECWATCSMSGL